MSVEQRARVPPTLHSIRSLSIYVGMIEDGVAPTPLSTRASYIHHEFLYENSLPRSSK